MRKQPSDTSPEAEEVLVRLARQMPPWRKLELASSMSETIRRAALAGICARHPEASAEEVQKRLAALLLPRKAVIAIFGWDPDLHGY